METVNDVSYVTLDCQIIFQSSEMSSEHRNEHANALLCAYII